MKAMKSFTAPFNNMWTLKFKTQVANAFFAAVNQMFNVSSQLPTTSERCVVVWTMLNDFITACSAVVGSWEGPPNIWLTVAKNAFHVIERRSREAYCEFYTKSFMLFQFDYPLSSTVSIYLPLCFSVASNLLVAHCDKIGFVIKLLFFCITFRSSSLLLSLLLHLVCCFSLDINFLRLLRFPFFSFARSRQNELYSLVKCG